MRCPKPFCDSRQLWYSATYRFSALQGWRHGVRLRSLGGIVYMPVTLTTQQPMTSDVLRWLRGYPRRPTLSTKNRGSLAIGSPVLYSCGLDAIPDPDLVLRFKRGIDAITNRGNHARDITPRQMERVDLWKRLFTSTRTSSGYMGSTSREPFSGFCRTRGLRASTS